MIGRHTIVVLLGTAGCAGKPQDRGPNQNFPKLGETPAAAAADAPSSREPPDLADCEKSPLSEVDYETRAELDLLLVGRWQRCNAPQARGEDVGVEFAKDGRWYALTRDAQGHIVRRPGIDYGGTWVYFPRGSVHPISHEPSDHAFFDLDGVITNAPSFTHEPRQMRIHFSPAQSRYLPLDPRNR